MLWAGQNGHHYPDNIFQCLKIHENCILIQILMYFIRVLLKLRLVQAMAWRQAGNNPSQWWSSMLIFIWHQASVSLNSQMVWNCNRKCVDELSCIMQWAFMGSILEP